MSFHYPERPKRTVVDAFMLGGLLIGFYMVWCALPAGMEPKQMPFQSTRIVHVG